MRITVLNVAEITAHVRAQEREGALTHSNRVPTRTGKPGKMGRHFPVREKSGNFEQTGKVREKSGKIAKNTGKLREFEINIIWYFYILFLVIFKWTVYCFLKWIKFSVKQTNTKKILENWKKYWKSQGKVREFCQSGKWEPCPSKWFCIRRRTSFRSVL